MTDATGSSRLAQNITATSTTIRPVPGPEAAFGHRSETIRCGRPPLVGPPSLRGSFNHCTRGPAAIGHHARPVPGRMLLSESGLPALKDGASVSVTLPGVGELPCRVAGTSTLGLHLSFKHFDEDLN